MNLEFPPIKARCFRLNIRKASDHADVGGNFDFSITRRKNSACRSAHAAVAGHLRS